MPLRSSHLTTLTTSAMWVSRSMLGLIKCERSPRPVSVGVNTLWPCFSSRSATRRQHQPPCQAPCTSTKVFCAVCAPACGAPPAAAAAPRLAPAASSVRSRGCGEREILKVPHPPAVDPRELARNLHLVPQDVPERLRQVAAEQDVEGLPRRDGRRKGAPDPPREGGEPLIGGHAGPAERER